MSYEVEIANLPHGFSTATFYKGEEATIVTTDFLTDVDGKMFYKCLENSQRLFLKPLTEANIRMSQVDHFLVLMKDNKAQVFVNELPFIVETIAKRDLKAGDIVSEHDIIGIMKLEFPNVAIPEDCGIAFFFSIGWKRGFFFDFRPNQGEKLQNINYTLGKVYEIVMYDDIYGLNLDLWKHIYRLGWFPFIAFLGKGQKHLTRIVSRIQENKSTHDFEADLVTAIDENQLNAIVERLAHNPFLQPHIQILQAGIERYLAGDYVSAINNIWLRIEGILRYVYNKNPKERINHMLENMEATFDGNLEYPGVFFPNQFKDYLNEYYFQDFDLLAGKLQVSRHSIAHGVSNAHEYDQKRALIGILIADQLGYYAKVGNTTIKST